MRSRELARRLSLVFVVLTSLAALPADSAAAQSGEPPEATLRRLEAAIAQLRAETGRHPEQAGLWQGWITQESMLIAARANLAAERGEPLDRGAVEAAVEERTRRICEEWMRARPADAAPAILLAGLGRTPDERDEAILELSARYPDDPDLVRRVAQILRFRGEEARAADTLEDFAARHPEEAAPPAVSEEGRRRLTAPAPAGSDSAPSPDAGEKALERAAALQDEGNDEAAIALLESYVERAGADSRVVEALGALLVGSGQLERAERLADRLGESRTAHLVRARVRAAGEDLGAAADGYRAYFSAGGFGDGPTFEYLATVAAMAPPARRSVELERTIDFLCAQRGVRGRDPEPVCAARLLELGGASAAASRRLDSAAAAAPENVKIAEAAALAAAAGTDARAAEAAARHWVGIAPKSLDAWTLLARVAGARGDVARVEGVVRESERALGEPAVGAVVELGRLLIDRGETRRALEWLNAARERYPWRNPALDEQLERGYRQLARQER